jgi:hypothetical protein
MARIRGRAQRRRGRLAERGAQALEYIALGSAVATMMGGAGIYAHDHGAEVGQLLFSHLHTLLGQ